LIGKFIYFFFNYLFIVYFRSEELNYDLRNFKFIVPFNLSNGRNSYQQKISLLKSKFEIEEISKRQKIDFN